MRRNTTIALAVLLLLILGAAIVQFRVPGGELGRYRSVFVGAPEFSVAQQVIVFLGSVGPAVPHLVGFSQGVYRVVAAADGAVVIPPAVLLWRSFDDGNGAYQLLVPVLVMAAGQLAGGLSWLAISGEDAPDLVLFGLGQGEARLPR